MINDNESIETVPIGGWSVDTIVEYLCENLAVAEA